MKLIYALSLAYLLLAIPAHVHAQTAPMASYSATWNAVTTGQTGQPLQAAPTYNVYETRSACPAAGPLAGPPVKTGLTAPAYTSNTVPATVSDVCVAVSASNNVGESQQSLMVGKHFVAVPPADFPMVFPATVGQTQTFTAHVVLAIPSGATSAVLNIQCNDCDHTDWGALSVNGNAPIQVWPNIGPSGSTAVLAVPVPLAQLVNGSNTIAITNSGVYQGGSVLGITAVFTTPVVPAQPTGLVVK